MPVACVADWSRNHDKTSLSHCHTHTHARTLTDKAVSQTRSAAAKCKRDTRRLLRLAAATRCCCTATTAFNMVQFAESSGMVYGGGHGEVTGSANPIGNLRICSVLPKNIAYVKCMRLRHPYPLSSITAQCTAYAMHATLLQVEYENVQGNQFTSFTSGFALRHFVCEGECACACMLVTLLVCVCVCVCVGSSSIHVLSWSFAL